MSMNFYQGQSVRIIYPNNNFHSKIGTITNIIDILGSNYSGMNITVRLDETGEEIYINQFSSITIISNDGNT